MSNKDLANKIIQCYSDQIVEYDTGYGLILDHIIGVSFGYTFEHTLKDGFVKTDIDVAKTDFVTQLTAMLDDGTLVLSDTWAEDNLG